MDMKIIEEGHIISTLMEDLKEILYGREVEEEDVMRYFDLSNKVAVVTGGGRGIGRTIALALSEAGATVAIVGRTKKVLEEAAADISNETKARYYRLLGT